MTEHSWPEHAISIKGLTKSYGGKGGRKLALNGLDLAIPRGSFFGLLGPNGAGKSTLINILAGLVMKSSGKVRVWESDLDTDARNARGSLGVVPQELNIDPFFTPRNLLEIQAGLFGVPKRLRKTDAILDMVGLTEKQHAYARTLSGGMRRRLLVGKAMVHRPPILILDEPTAGVDVELRHHLWESVTALNRQGVTILLTTHYLEEAEELCDRIAIIHQGQLVAHDEKHALLRRMDSKSLRIVLNEQLESLPTALSALGAFLTQGEKATLDIHYAPSTTSAGEILHTLQGLGLSVHDVSTTETDLEDIFIGLTSGKGAP